jgi:hypothetical protein
MRKINKVIIHCSDSTHDEPISIIREWHLARGFKDVGYHFYIRKSGQIELGRPIDQVGSHTFGENKDSLGVCFAGKHDFTAEQFYTGKKLNWMLFMLFNCSFEPHSKYSHEGKTCPNFDIKLVMPDRKLYLVP